MSNKCSCARHYIENTIYGYIGSCEPAAWIIDSKQQTHDILYCEDQVQVRQIIYQAYPYDRFIVLTRNREHAFEFQLLLFDAQDLIEKKTECKPLTTILSPLPSLQYIQYIPSIQLLLLVGLDEKRNNRLFIADDHYRFKEVSSCSFRAPLYMPLSYLLYDNQLIYHDKHIWLCSRYRIQCLYSPFPKSSSESKCTDSIPPLESYFYLSAVSFKGQFYALLQKNNADNSFFLSLCVLGKANESWTVLKEFNVNNKNTPDKLVYDSLQGCFLFRWLSFRVVKDEPIQWKETKLDICIYSEKQKPA